MIKARPFQTFCQQLEDDWRDHVNYWIVGDIDGYHKLGEEVLINRKLYLVIGIDTFLVDGEVRSRVDFRRLR